MASAGSRALPKMAAGGQARRLAGARGRSRREAGGPELPGRQRQRRRRPPGRCAKGSLEDGRPATASAEPAGKAPPTVRRQERGGPRRPSPPSSHKVADRRPSKKLKCEKNSLLKSELGLTCGSAGFGETPKTSDGDRHSEDLGDCNVIQKKKGESIPETNKEKQKKEDNVSFKPHAVKSSSAPLETGSDENLHNHVCSEEEGSSESLLSDGSSLEDGDLPKKPIELDNSIFLDEDSNQPMPVARFFGDVEFIKDLPPVALPSTTMNRREFRRLHFIAKEDEEEEEGDVF